MPKFKSSPVYTCDICDFKATNGYIFKRHLHRCLSLHGIASKRSSSRNPIRLKGTEGLLSKESTQEDTKDMPSFSGLTSDDDDDDDNDQELLDDGKVEMLQNAGENEEEKSQDQSLQWGLTSDSRMDLDQAELPNEDFKDPGETSENTMVADSSLFVPGAPYCRQYSCSECSYVCKSARDYLLHQRNDHGHKMKIYACKICDYASRYGNKVERHLTVHSKLNVHIDDQTRRLMVLELTSPSPEQQAEASSFDPTLIEATESMPERPKVQPLKLKRLNIRMPFKVSKSLKLKSSSLFTSGKRSKIQAAPQTSNGTPKARPGSFKELYKMVLSEDGSHHYQCRDCLYYAPIPSSVKKHHVLCHGRILCCPHCSLTTTSQGILYEHLVTHDGLGYVKCPDCSYVTNAKCNYEKHRSFHTGVFPFHCTVCSFGADTESKIKRHVAMQHMPLNVTVEEEQDVLDASLHNSSDTEPVGHDSEDICEAFSLDGETEAGENGESVKRSSGRDSPHTEYRCPKCPMVCYRRGNFTRHLTAKHKFNQSTAASLSKTIEGHFFKGLKRKRAGSSFPGLKQMRLQNTENLKCSHCSYIAKWPSDLRRHMQVHTLVKRFKCSICTNKYKYLGDLNVHMRRDHNTEPTDNIAREVSTSDVLIKASPAIFRCPICPFTSHSKAELEQHSRNHGNIEKTYQCRQCDYQTYWRGDVSRHLFRHHKIVLSKEATEIGEYFLHRPDIKPLTKQGPSIGGGSLSPSPSPDSAKSSVLDGITTPEIAPKKNLFSMQNSSGSLKKNAAGPGTVFLKEGSFVCEHPNCDFKTTISDRMETHLAVHQNLKMFMCPTCGKRTNWKWDVVKHMNKVHMNAAAAIEDVITLSIDEAKASIQNYLVNYEKKSKDLTVSYCSLCPFKSLERNRVVRHMGTIHKNENGKVISQSIYQPCELDNSSDVHTEEGNESVESGRRFSIDGLTELLAPKFIEPPPEEIAKFDKPYACAICKKPGSSKGDVKKHYNYTHPYKDVRILYVGDGTEFNYYTGEIYNKSSRSDQAGDSPDFRTGPLPMNHLGKILRPDSKFSNPKMHGYVKPFKCSICGLRSNWKWDLKKHLRSKHPNEGGFVILLSIEEASETYGRDCTPSHPKNEDFLSIFSSPSLSPAPSVTPTNPSPISSVDHVFKPPPNIKAEILLDSISGDSQDESLSSFFPQSPASSLSPSPHLKGRDQSHFVASPRRQWRCSGCNYVSKWRRNMARHIHRRHPDEEDQIQIMPFYKETSDFSMDDSANLTQDDTSMDMENRYSTVSNQGSLDKKLESLRLWNCNHCAFSSKLRTHIIVHMQQHEMKPFSCGVCGILFMNRGPLHRHLQKVHKRSDYLKLCKLNIKYADDAGDTSEDMTRSEYINSYFCRLCNLECANRHEVIKHLQDIHDSADFDNNILKIQKHVGGSAKRRAALARFSKRDSQKLDKKFHFCAVCPFRTQKKSMLAFHMTYHKPNPANRFKCKHCPYYVGALRLLHQHQRKWHKELVSKLEWEQEEQATPSTSPAKLHASANSPVGTPRRHCCEKCPYTTNSKNDFIYHKQFHRPKRTAEFKCEYCDYWVVHKRLLKQHMRLHTGASAKPVDSLNISPAKSLCSDPGLVYDPMELTELAAIKQKMISAKITASLSKSPTISPMKIASQCSVDNKPGYIVKNGLYRKLHKCRYCPYTNIRSRNMQLHEMMHGPRESSHPLMKCPYCDYYVGSKGLLSHHMKVHQKNYGDTPENDVEFADNGDTVDIDEDSDQDILPQQKVDTLLQISRFKRFGCERCPYASAKRQHFVRHLELHGSRQRYTCQYCDYSVPSNNLLLQHTKLHMMPNQNLLASQSITNLQHMSEVPADVALASALPPADSDTTVTISVIHDHLGLYENSIYDTEPKKLYRCDRCPYANVRRDYLLSHLKFHMVPSSLVCPYCDYSAPKQPLLTQHIRVHFCPLPELSDWLLENGQTERETSQRNLDLAEALKVAHEYQNLSRKKEIAKTGISTVDRTVSKEDKLEGKENIQANRNGDAHLTYICQYCDREFPASDKLVKHELQHLIGNHFERTEYISRNKQTIEQATMQMLNAQGQQLQQDQEYFQQPEDKTQDTIETETMLSDDTVRDCGETAPLDCVDSQGKVKEKRKKKRELGDKTKHPRMTVVGASDIKHLQESDSMEDVAREVVSSLISSRPEENNIDKATNNGKAEEDTPLLARLHDTEASKCNDSINDGTNNSPGAKFDKVRKKRKKSKVEKKISEMLKDTCESSEGMEEYQGDCEPPVEKNVSDERLNNDAPTSKNSQAMDDRELTGEDCNKNEADIEDRRVEGQQLGNNIDQNSENVMLRSADDKTSETC